MTVKKNSVRKSALHQKSQLMSASEIERTLVRLAHQILEKNSGSKGWAWLAFAGGAFRLLSDWAR